MMKQIFTKNEYQILVDIDQRKACIVKGSSSVFVSLEELTPLSSLAAKHLRMMGCDPKRYMNIGLTNQVILKEAAPAWEEAVAETRQTERKTDTSLIPAFWHHLPGLLELREAEDTYAACQKSASLMLEYQQRGFPPTKLMQLRKKYPRAAAYILAEAYAFSGNDEIAGRGRRAMHILIASGEIKDALSLLPDTPPDNLFTEQQRMALTYDAIGGVE